MKNNQYILITGASSGLGEEFAKQLARKGHNLVITARRLERLEKLANELKTQFSVDVIPLFSDLSRPNGAAELFSQSTKNISVIGLINNAGIGFYGDFSDHSLPRHQSTMQLNMLSLVELTYSFVQHMKSHNHPSFILNIGSLAAFLPIPMFSVYAATKAFVHSFSEALNFELKNTNIQVTVIHPGGTTTEFMEHAEQIVLPHAKAGMMSAESVVQLSLRAVDYKRSSYVTGRINRLASLLTKLSPTKLAMILGYQIMKRMVIRKKISLD